MSNEESERPPRGGLAPGAAGVAPGSPRREAPVPSLSDQILILVLYLTFAGTTVYLAIRAYTPCAMNFEGGCGMGRGLLAMASLVTSAVAAGTGRSLKRIVMHRSRAPRESATAFAASLLWALPLIYMPLTLYDLFFG